MFAYLWKLTGGGSAGQLRDSAGGRECAMSAEVVSFASMNRDTASRLVRAGLVTGVVDAIFSSVLVTVFYHSTVTRLWQGVASVPLGKEALNGGTTMALIGLLLHFGVAFWWSAVFLLLYMRSARIRDLVASRYGMVKVAVLYGPFIWLVMSLAVIPLLAHRPPTINFRWWVQLLGHIPFVAIPIVASVSKGSGRRENPATHSGGYAQAQVT